MGRIALTLTGLGISVLLVLATWLFVGAPGVQHRDGTSAVGAAAWDGAIRPPIPPLDYTGLVDERGRPAPPLAGDVTIVTFLYTDCQDICPATAQQIRLALDRLDRQPRVVAISVDPTGDTPQAARRFLADQSLAGRMHYLVGPSPALARQWRQYGVQPQLANADHSAVAVILDKTGKQQIGFPADKLTPEALAHDVERLQQGELAAAPLS